LRGAGVKYPDIAAGRADAPDFGAPGVFADVGNALADGDFLEDAEIGEVEDGDGAVAGGNVCVEMEVRAEEGGTMFAEENDDDEDEKDGEYEVDAEGFEARHWRE